MKILNIIGHQIYRLKLVNLIRSIKNCKDLEILDFRSLGTNQVIEPTMKELKLISNHFRNLKKINGFYGIQEILSKLFKEEKMESIDESRVIR